LHYKSLDGLRGLAAFMVVVGHYENQTKSLDGLLEGSGQLAVMIFFCLSGFLMGRLYLTKETTTRTVAAFAQRRIARVVPLYIALVLVSYFYIKITGARLPMYHIEDNNILEHLLFWEGTSVLWTIAVEVQFYAVFPLIWFAYRRLGYAVIIWLALAAAWVTILNFPSYPVLITYAPYFMTGVAISLIPQSFKVKGANVLFLALLVSLFVSYPGVREILGVMARGTWKSTAYMFLIPALLVATLHAPIAEKILGNRVAKFAGDISYSIYLLHMPVMYTLMSTEIVQNDAAFFATYIACATTLAWLSYRFFETPARRWISSIGSRERLAAQTT